MSQRSLSDFGGTPPTAPSVREEVSWQRVVPVDYKNHYSCPMCLSSPRYFTTEGTEHHPDESRCGYCGSWLPIRNGRPGEWGKVVSVKEAASMVMKTDIRILKND